MDSEDTKVIVQFCFLVDASLKAVNDNYELKDGSAVFGDLAQANELKKSISKSYGRYLKSTNHDRDGVTRYGSRGNKIAFTPLPEDFDIGTKIYPKRGARGFKLPEWSTELYNNQFGRSTVTAARTSREIEDHLDDNGIDNTDVINASAGNNNAIVNSVDQPVQGGNMGEFWSLVKTFMNCTCIIAP